MRTRERGVMPREKIREIESDPNRVGRSLEISWNRIGWVQLNVIPDGWGNSGEWEIIDLRPRDVDALIKVLKKAKKQAYGDGQRHYGYWDNETERLEAAIRSANLSPEDNARLVATLLS